MKTKTAYMMIIMMMSAIFPIGEVYAQIPKEDTGQAGELTDKIIDERKQALNEMLNQTIAGMETKFQSTQKMQLRIKNERIAFEKQRVAERRAFLESLKKVKMEQRKSAMAGFNREQSEKQRAFIEQQNTLRKQYLNELDLEMTSGIKQQRSRKAGQQRGPGPRRGRAKPGTQPDNQQ